MKILILALISMNVFADSPMVALGERIFNDVRFSKHYFQQSNNNVNTGLDEIVEPEKVVSCSTCHMIDQSFDDLGMRGYNDFEARTTLTLPVDGMTRSLRNTPSLVGIGSQYSRHNISHHDGELVHSETYLGNFTGPHMGWKKEEKEVTLANIVKVLREDNGDQEYLSYATLFLGIDPAIPDDMRLPEEWRRDISKLSDSELINYMVELGTTYLFNIDFEVDESGHYIGSMYDRFLKLNNIDRGPSDNETVFEYTARIFREFQELKDPKLISKEFFPNHKKEFGFGQQEWNGLKVFFNISENGGRGMCIQCHTAPLFTDQSFHNVAVTQKAYDQVNGEGSFAKLEVPELKERNEYEVYFLEGKDLGVWNFFAREGKGTLTKFIKSEFCRDPSDCDEAWLLPFMAARFKTPSLRNLGMSEPYFHDGSARTIEETLVHYRDFSEKVRMGEVVNPAPQMRMMRISDQDIEDLKAFIDSLNENYE